MRVEHPLLLIIEYFIIQNVSETKKGIIIVISIMLTERIMLGQ